MFTATRFDRFLAVLAFVGASFYLVACAHLVQLLNALRVVL